MSPDHAALRCDGVTKRYGPTVALRNVSIDVPFGEVHGLIGHNGSGKSTLVKILTGVVQRDAGEIDLDGARAPREPTPQWWSGHGVSVVHQDLGLVPRLSVWENLLVGRMSRNRIGWFSPRAARAAAERELVALGSSIPCDALVLDLSDAERAELAILRAAAAQRHLGRPGVLVLDEPTAYLPVDGVRRLFQVMREVANAGGTVVFISHKLGEVLSICDRITVLRGGEVVGVEASKEHDESSLAEVMLGVASTPIVRTRTADDGEVRRVRVRGLSSCSLRSLDLDVAKGEIVGVTGLAGSGHDELPYALFGAFPGAQGTLELDGRTLDVGGLSPRTAVDSGIALVPGNRLRDGIFSNLGLADNVGVLHDRRFCARGVVDVDGLRRWTESLMTNYGVVARDSGVPIGALSGGNQQKIVVAKWFETNAGLLCLHEPTQGVDIGAKRVIISYLQRAAERGASVIVSSVETEELLDFCHRIVVVRLGQVVLQAQAGDVDVHTIDRLVIGATERDGNDG
jgi:ribose transport system ATP-binding protein